MVLTVILGFMLLGTYYMKGYKILILMALILPYIMKKLFGGEPDLNPSKIKIDDKFLLNNLFQSGINLGERGQYAEAIEIFDKVLNIDSKNVDVLASKAYALCCLHKYEEAIISCDKALKINPKHGLALDNLDQVGVCFGELGRYTEAMEIFDKILKIDPKNAGTIANKANILTRLNQDEESVMLCDETLRYDSKNLYALNNKAAAFTNLNKYQEAMEIFDKILNIDSKNVDAIKNKSRCYYKCYEKLGILKKLPRYTIEEISNLSTETLIKERDVILAEKYGS